MCIGNLEDTVVEIRWSVSPITGQGMLYALLHHLVSVSQGTLNLNGKWMPRNDCRDDR